MSSYILICDITISEKTRKTDEVIKRKLSFTLTVLEKGYPLFTVLEAEESKTFDFGFDLFELPLPHPESISAIRMHNHPN